MANTTATAIVHGPVEYGGLGWQEWYPTIQAGKMKELLLMRLAGTAVGKAVVSNAIWRTQWWAATAEVYCDTSTEGRLGDAEEGPAWTAGLWRYLETARYQLRLRVGQRVPRDGDRDV